MTTDSVPAPKKSHQVPTGSPRKPSRSFSAVADISGAYPYLPLPDIEGLR